MAVVDPYSPCPCGSGQKFKWCCNKVEAHAERAQRLFASGQPEAAIKALDEGLRKDPGNAWLLTRKALIQIRQNQPKAARQSLDLVLKKNPKHAGALILKTHLVLETEGPAAGVAQFQRTLSATPPENRKVLAGLARVVGVVLGEHGRYAAALKHLALVPMLFSGQDDETGSSVRLIERSASVTPWQKNPATLSPPPEGLDSLTRERFQGRSSWAEQGLWSTAAVAFELLAAEVVEAERNLGLCRLWLANDAGAVVALRRYVTRVGATTEAVDLEALCQEIAPLGPHDLVAHVQLNWPLRDREGLLQALRGQDRPRGWASADRSGRRQRARSRSVRAPGPPHARPDGGTPPGGGPQGRRPGARRPGDRGAGDLRRRPARRPGRTLRQAGRSGNPADATAQQGIRKGGADDAGAVVGLETPQGRGSQGGGAARPGAGCVAHP